MTEQEILEMVNASVNPKKDLKVTVWLDSGPEYSILIPTELIEGGKFEKPDMLRRDGQSYVKVAEGGHLLPFNNDRIVKGWSRELECKPTYVKE